MWWKKERVSRREIDRQFRKGEQQARVILQILLFT